MKPTRDRGRKYGKCPLCEQRSNLDFHHWTYRPERGVYLCRPCHNYIHRPDGARPSEASGDDWLFPATQRLVERHIRKINSQPLKDEILTRYGIPDDVAWFVGQALDDQVDLEQRKKRHRKKSLRQAAEVKAQIADTQKETEDSQ